MVAERVLCSRNPEQLFACKYLYLHFLRLGYRAIALVDVCGRTRILRSRVAEIKVAGEVSCRYMESGMVPHQ